MEEVKSKGSGVSFTGLLTVLFIGLKLSDVIDWSWLWVLAPLWLPIALAIGTLLIGLFIAIIAAVVKTVLKEIEDKKD